MKNILVLVPHGDDEVLLAGASISKHKRSGDRVSVCIVKCENTERNAKQLNQSKKVSQYLNIDNIYHVNLLEINNLTIIANKLEKFLKDKNFDTLYTIHCDDNHQEHRLVFDAISIATRSHGPCSIPNIFSGETLSSTSQRLNSLRPFIPTYYNVVNQQDINNKINALSFYTDEVKSHPHQRSPESVKALAVLRGSECFASLAEAFMPLRQVIS
jgi:LmbE family N-acetylglucosaminyl deacetylase